MSNAYHFMQQEFLAYSGSTVTSYCNIEGCDFISVQIYKSSTGSFIQTPLLESSNFTKGAMNIPYSGSTEGGYWVKQGLSGTQTLLTSSGAPASVEYEHGVHLCTRWVRFSFQVYESDLFRINWCARG